MDKKVKVKYRKKEKKYVYNYLGVRNKQSFRFDLLQRINESHKCVFFIDTSLGRISSKEIIEKYYLDDALSYQKIIDYLDNNVKLYEVKKRQRPVPNSIMGISTTKINYVEDIILAVYLDIGQLTKEFFEILLCTHDYIIGVTPLKSEEQILEDFKNDTSIIPHQDYVDFKYTIVDSRMIYQFYSDLELT